MFKPAASRRQANATVQKVLYFRRLAIYHGFAIDAAIGYCPRFAAMTVREFDATRPDQG
jgi:hypothetical protein